MRTSEGSRGEKSRTSRVYVSNNRRVIRLTGSSWPLAWSHDHGYAFRKECFPFSHSEDMAKYFLPVLFYQGQGSVHSATVGKLIICGDRLQSFITGNLDKQKSLP